MKNKSKKEKGFMGTHTVRATKNIAISCISPEAKSLLEKVETEYAKHYGQLKKLQSKLYTPISPEDAHGHFYWLIRHSGLVKPNN